MQQKVSHTADAWLGVEREQVIGIVIPVYRPTQALPRLLSGLHTVLGSQPHRVYLVDDSGREQAHAYLKSNCQIPGLSVTVIRLAENVGQQNALLCGLRAALPQCGVFVTMDDDGQHNPALLPALLALLPAQYGLAYAVPHEVQKEEAVEKKQGERGAKGRFAAKPLLKKLDGLLRVGGSYARDVLFRLLLGVPRGMRVSSYRACTREVAEAVCAWQGRFFYCSAVALRAQIKPVVRNLTCPACPRGYGQSGYTVCKLLQLYANLVWYYGLRCSQKPAQELYRVESVEEWGG